MTPGRLNAVYPVTPRRPIARGNGRSNFSETVSMFQCSDEPAVGYSVREESTAGTGTPLVYMTVGYFLHFVLHHLGVATGSSHQNVPDMFNLCEHKSTLVK